MVGKKSVTLKF